VALHDPMCLLCTNVNITEFTAFLQLVHYITNILIMCLTYNEGKNLIECGEIHTFFSSAYHNNIPKENHYKNK